MDFGVRKPHLVILGRSGTPIAVEKLKNLGLRGCQVYLEEGCPRNELYGILEDNQVFTIDGKYVKRLRDRIGEVKSDFNDVCFIRELALTKPEAFRQVTVREREEIVNEMTYAYYSRITRLIASLLICQKDFLRQFGEAPPHLETTLDTLRKERSKVAYHFHKFEDVARILKVRGLGTIAAISAKANPHRFRSLQAYLRYCGLRAEARASGNYDRRIKGIYYQLGRDVVMHRDPKFYSLYLEIKANLRNRFPEYRKGKIDGMARNRLATLLAKHMYHTLHLIPRQAEQ